MTNTMLFAEQKCWPNLYKKMLFFKFHNKSYLVIR